MDPLYPLFTQRRRRTATLRIIVLVVAIACCYVAVVSFVAPLHCVNPAQDGHQAFAKTKRSAVQADSIIEKGARPSILREDALEQTPLTESHDLGPQDVPQSTPITGPAYLPAQASINHDADDDTDGEDLSRFTAAFKHVLSLLPDEIHVRELLRPIEGTGKERLRETGLRARAFKPLLEAWEALHFVSSGDVTYIRDDVVQFLRSHHELIDISPLSLAQATRSYEAFRSVLARLSTLLFPWTAPYFSDHMTLHSHFHKGGRGIVLSAGDNQAPFLLTSIQSFRRLGCTLPIEIMYLGDEDLSEDFRAELEALPDVITRDLSQMVNDEGWHLAGWAGKPFAILMSSFREVIFIDADALFFRDPELLFEDPLYRETGALFFKDRLIMPESKKRWLQQILPKPISVQVRQSRFWTGESGHMQESGVVVVDKWQHFVALLLVTRMNGPDRDGNKDEGKIGVYDMVYGDKETFWIAWELVGDLRYAFHDGDAGIMGTVQDQPQKDSEEKEKSAKDDSSKENSHGEDHEGDEAGSKELKRRELDAEPTSVNFTICAPQLLHLDMKGRPFWFNGWLSPNKFADDKHKKFKDFEVYMKEPREIQEPGAWQLKENNECCLTNDHLYEFTQAEKNTLKMITDIAKDVGAFGKR